MTLTEIEHNKYCRMWKEVPEYRLWSPGENLVEMFLQSAPWQHGETLIDVGCGMGRAGVALAQAGLNVTLLDITEEALAREARHLPFIQACLWELKTDGPRYDWTYCCDVLEHIPTEKVGKVLDTIAALASGAFLQIALSADICGSYIGETLHLTVKPVEWWLDRISPRWGSVECLNSDNERLVLLCMEKRI